LLDEIKEFRDKIGHAMKWHKEGNRHIALLVDGPNILRKEFRISLADIKKELERFGILKVAKVYLDQYAPEKLIEAVTNLGFEPVITCTDVDVLMSVEATELIFNDNIDIIAVMTRDADFQPVIRKAKEHGKETIVVGTDPGFSNALKNTADYIINISELK
jgi:uncharacterized protein (TIGR00288 family)